MVVSSCSHSSSCVTRSIQRSHSSPSLEPELLGHRQQRSTTTREGSNMAVVWPFTGLLNSSLLEEELGMIGPGLIVMYYC